jgi:hypothetical protein
MQDRARLINSRGIELALIIEPFGDILPMPARAIYTTVGAEEISIEDDSITIWVSHYEFSVFLYQYELYTSKVYSGEGTAYPDLPPNTSLREFIESTLRDHAMQEERNSLITQLSLIPNQMEEAAEQAAKKPQPDGQWSLRTIFIHEAAVDIEIWQMRFQMLAEEENPQWPWAEPDIAQWEKEYEHLSMGEVIENFVNVRGEIVAYLRSLDHASWIRTGTHAVYGPMDVTAMCKKMLEHDREHLAEIQKRSGG